MQTQSRQLRLMKKKLSLDSGELRVPTRGGASNENPRRKLKVVSIEKIRESTSPKPDKGKPPGTQLEKILKNLVSKNKRTGSHQTLSDGRESSVES
jgi:hypothetical protein